MSKTKGVRVSLSEKCEKKCLCIIQFSYNYLDIDVVLL